MDQSPPSLPSESPRRDAVGWVLSAVTAAVLVLGVMVVRSTRSEPAVPPIKRGGDATQRLGAPAEQANRDRPRVIWAMPETPGKDARSSEQAWPDARLSEKTEPRSATAADRR